MYPAHLVICETLKSGRSRVRNEMIQVFEVHESVAMQRRRKCIAEVGMESHGVGKSMTTGATHDLPFAVVWLLNLPQAMQEFQDFCGHLF